MATTGLNFKMLLHIYFRAILVQDQIMGGGHAYDLRSTFVIIEMYLNSYTGNLDDSATAEMLSLFSS